jgi:V/A-type H+-transporting ATPase subunit I
MIVPMKRVTVIVLDTRRNEELVNLKRLGVLHPEVEARSDSELEELHADHELIDRALQELPAEERKKRPQPAAAATGDAAGIGGDPTGSGGAVQAEPPADPQARLDAAMHAAHHVHTAAEHLRGRREVVARIHEEVTRVALWGEFDPHEFERLKGHGVELHLYTMDAREYRKGGPQGAIVAFTDRQTTGFVMAWFRENHPSGLSVAEVDALPGVRRFQLPEISLSALRHRQTEESAAAEKAREDLDGLIRLKPVLAGGLAILEDRIHDRQVRLGMDTAERIAYIDGYVPEDRVEALKDAATANGWGLYIRDPDPADQVPTKIHNPRWIRIIEPVFNLLGVVPGYRERDISFFFLLFFIAFVGMIIGDAGYGSILLIGAVIGIVRGLAKRKVADGVLLLAVLSVSTIAWGSMTGNWFGYEPIGEMIPFRYLVVPALNSFDPASTQAVQSVCFVLAAIHLSIAHLWNLIRAIRQRPRIKAIAQLGWLGIVLALYMLVVSLFVGGEFPRYALYMIAGGLAAVFIFSEQSADRGFFGGVLRGLANAFQIIFGGIGAFSDIISYIRLFAVGLATVAIAQAFNGIAAGIGGGVGGIIGGALVLAAGHTLNLIMGGLAVVVHGVRLNLLEFSGHLGMEWTGVVYQPFAENRTGNKGVQV